MEIIGPILYVSCSFIWISALVNGEAEPQSTLAKLRRDLLKDYDVNTRPTLYHSNETIVTVTMYPFYIQDLDEERHIFTMDAWMELSWVDEHMKWDPSAYDNVATLMFDQEEIWRPSMITLWSSPTSSIDPYGRSPMNIEHDGSVLWRPSAVFRIQCILDYTNYPNDQQRCSFNMSAISVYRIYIDLYISSQQANLRSFLDTNPKWALVETKIEKPSLFYFKYLHFSFLLKRRMPYGGDVEWTFSIVTLILTLIMFWMPPEKGKKLTLGLTCLLILFGQLLFFTLTSPSRAIAIYTARMIQQSVFAVTSAILLEIIVLNLTRISEFAPPTLLLNFLSGPARNFLCFCPQDEKKSSLQKDWYIIALGLDRVLFVLYSIVFVSLKTWV